MNTDNALLILLILVVYGIANGGWQTFKLFLMSMRRRQTPYRR